MIYNYAASYQFFFFFRSLKKIEIRSNLLNLDNACLFQNSSCVLFGGFCLINLSVRLEQLIRTFAVMHVYVQMDRASILGDAIEYLRELLQRINDLHNELESSAAPPSTSFHPLTPTPLTIPCRTRVKEELCPTSLASPKSQQPPAAKVKLSSPTSILSMN